MKKKISKKKRKRQPPVFEKGGSSESSRNKRWRERNPESYILSRARDNAKKAGLDFNLEIEDIIIPERCPVFDVPLEMSIGLGGGPRKQHAPSIDRIDNSKGYVKGNIVIVSWRVNMLKKSATIQELCKIANFYKELINEDDLHP